MHANFNMHIDIKFMQKLSHAHTHKCLQNTSVQTLSCSILILNEEEHNSQSYEEREYNSCLCNICII